MAVSCWGYKLRLSGLEVGSHFLAAVQVGWAASGLFSGARTGLTDSFQGSPEPAGNSSVQPPVLDIHIHIHIPHPSLLASGRDLAPLLPPPNCCGCFPQREHRHSRRLELRRTGDGEQPVFDSCAPGYSRAAITAAAKLPSLAPSVHLGAFR